MGTISSSIFVVFFRCKVLASKKYYVATSSSNIFILASKSYYDATYLSCNDTYTATIGGAIVQALYPKSSIRAHLLILSRVFRRGSFAMGRACASSYSSRYVDNAIIVYWWITSAGYLFKFSITTHWHSGGNSSGCWPFHILEY